MFENNFFKQIEEANSLTGNFIVFKQCGMLEIIRTTQGHRLLIKLVSNNDHLTSKGFEIKLKGIKNYIYFTKKEQISHFTISPKQEDSEVIDNGFLILYLKVMDTILTELFKFFFFFNLCCYQRLLRYSTN